MHVLKTENFSEEEHSILYYDIAHAYLDINLDSASYYASTGLRLAEELDYADGAVKNTVILGSVAMRKDSLIMAHSIFQTALKHTKTTSDQKAIITIWLKLGMVADLLSNHKQSLEYYFRGLHMADSIDDIRLEAKFLNNIAIIYGEEKNSQISLEYFIQASRLFKDLGEEKYYGTTLLNISSIFIDLELKDSAYFYLEKSREINEKLGNNYGLLIYYGLLGKLAFNEGKYEKALTHIRQMDVALDKMDDSFFGSKLYQRTEVFHYYGEIYMHIEEYDKAIESYKLAIKNAKLIGIPQIVAKSGKGLSETYEKIGNSDSAFVYFKLYKAYSDSLNEIETIKKITELQLSYEFDLERKQMQNEKEITEAVIRNHKMKNLIIIGASVLGFMILFLLLLNQRNQHKHSRLKEQNLKLEKENLSKNLEFKKKELTANVMYLLKKNTFISVISKKLEAIDCSGQKQNLALSGVINELDKNSSEEVWVEFETRFKEVYGDFNQQLSIKFPNLTPNELKLAAFLKLNLSSKEISRITYQTTETLKTARHRLRKKLGLSREDNLVAFLNQI